MMIGHVATTIRMRRKCTEGEGDLRPGDVCPRDDCGVRPIGLASYTRIAEAPPPTHHLFWSRGRTADGGRSAAKRKTVTSILMVRCSSRLPRAMAFVFQVDGLSRSCGTFMYRARNERGLGLLSARFLHYLRCAGNSAKLPKSSMQSD